MINPSARSRDRHAGPNSAGKPSVRAPTGENGDNIAYTDSSVTRFATVGGASSEPPAQTSSTSSPPPTPHRSSPSTTRTSRLVATTTRELRQAITKGLGGGEVGGQWLVVEDGSDPTGEVVVGAVVAQYPRV